MVSHSLAFFHRSAERWGPDWGPVNLLISKNDLNSSACEVYWLPFTAPAALHRRTRPKISTAGRVGRDARASGA